MHRLGVQGCKGARVQGCRGAGVQGRRAAGLQGWGRWGAEVQVCRPQGELVFRLSLGGSCPLGAMWMPCDPGNHPCDPTNNSCNPCQHAP